MADGLPDPRARVVDRDGALVLEGVRCSACGYAVGFPRPRCPACGAAVAPAAFGPEGTVWSATLVRVPVPGRTPPYGLAYVDLDDGPRILVHTEGDERLAVGTRVRLGPPTEHGDVTVAAVPA